MLKRGLSYLRARCEGQPAPRSPGIRFRVQVLQVSRNRTLQALRQVKALRILELPKVTEAHLNKNPATKGAWTNIPKRKRRSEIQGSQEGLKVSLSSPCIIALQQTTPKACSNYQGRQSPQTLLQALIVLFRTSPIKRLSYI